MPTLAARISSAASVGLEGLQCISNEQQVNADPEKIANIENI
jgi:hypothetical protein